MNSANELLSLRSAMDQLFQDSVNRMLQPEGNGSRNGQSYEGSYLVPRADAWENDEQVVIELALPGVEPQNVDITFEQDVLTIQGQFSSREEGRNWILRERPRGSFRRRFNLQVPVEVDNVEARYQNGLLLLTLPKSEASKPRKIEVKAVGNG